MFSNKILVGWMHNCQGLLSLDRPGRKRIISLTACVPSPRNAFLWIACRSANEWQKRIGNALMYVAEKNPSGSEEAFSLR